jgi:hypothetical protein
MRWNETSREKQFEIMDQMQAGTKSPLQILLDAGITPSDGWVKELTFATDLLSNIKAKLPVLEAWLTGIAGPYDEEDAVYRFYHQYYKIFERFQVSTEKGFQLIKEIGGDGTTINEWYLEIYQDAIRYDSMAQVAQATGENMNEHWLKYARPILEGFWHTKYFIQMMVKYGKELNFAPIVLPSGWAAILTLYYGR